MLYLKGKKTKRRTIISFSLIIFFLIVLIPDTNFSKENIDNDNIYNNEDSFTILYTADEHSALVPHTPTIDYHPEKSDLTKGGFARLDTAMSEIKNEVGSGDLLKVSAGDFLSGNPFSWLSLKGKSPELDLMQKIGFDVITLGNHEYDFGLEFLSAYLERANYPEKSEDTALLATNTYIPSEHSLSERNIEEYKIKELENGLEVGIIGILGTDAQYFIRDVKPIEFLPQVEAAKNTVDTLEEKGVDVIISVNHAGLEVNKFLAEEIEEIDVIVGGHTHKAIFEPFYVDDTIIVQPGSHLKYLGRLELSYNHDNDELNVSNEKKNIEHLIKIDDNFEESQEIRREINEYIVEFNQWIEELTGGNINNLFEVVSYSDEVISRGPAKSETPLGNLLTDSMIKEAEKAKGKEIDFAFQVNGQIRDDVIPGTRRGVENKITFYDLARVAGMGQTYRGTPGYPMTVIKLTEKEIQRFLEGTLLASEFAGNRAFFQVSGLKYNYDPDRVVLFSFPFRGMNIPIPTLRAIDSVKKYHGDSLQGKELQNGESGNYIPLEDDGRNKYKIVVDQYVLEFINMASDYLPFFYSIEPKNIEGEPINGDDINELILYRNETPLTLWEVLVNYSKEEGDISHYAKTQGRINKTSMLSPYVFLTIVVVAIIAFITSIIVMIRRWRKKKFMFR